MKSIILSNDPDVSTFICPSCKAIWRARGEAEHFLGGWHFNDEDICPHGCKTFLFFKVRGDEVDDYRTITSQ